MNKGMRLPPTKGISAASLVALCLVGSVAKPSAAQDQLMDFSDLDVLNGPINDHWFGYRNDEEQVLMQAAGGQSSLKWSYGASDTYRTFEIDLQVLQDDGNHGVIGLFCCRSEGAVYPAVMLNGDGRIDIIDLNPDGSIALQESRDHLVAEPGHAVLAMTETAHGYEVSVDGVPAFTYEREGSFDVGISGIFALNGGVYAIHDFAIYGGGEKALSGNDAEIEQVVEAN